MRKIEDCNADYSKLCGMIGDLEIKKFLLVQEVGKLQAEATEITKVNEEVEKLAKKSPEAEASGPIEKEPK